MLSHFFERWLAAMPNIWIFLIICGVMVVTVVLAPRVRRRLIRRTIAKEYSDAANDTFKAIIPYVMLLLTFSLVQVQGQFRSAEEIVSKEANTLNVMDRTMLRFGMVEVTAGRQVLKDYARSVTQDEWPVLGFGDRARATSAVFDQLNRVIQSIEPVTNRQQSLHHQLLVHLDELADFREHRIASAELGLTDIYWWTVISLFLLLVILASIAQPTVDRAVTLGGLTCAVGLMLSLVVITDKPFSGQTMVSPAPIERVIRVMGTRS